MFDFDNTEITAYQKQKVRDFVSAVNKNAFQYENVHTYEIASKIAAQAVPYLKIVEQVNTYLQSEDPDAAYSKWVTQVNPTYFEDLFFHTVTTGFMVSMMNPIPDAVKTEWVNICDMMLTYVDGANWDTFLSDADKVRELTDCLNLTQIAECLQSTVEQINQVKDGEEFEIVQKTVLDALHRVYEQAITVFAVNALAQLWFETPDSTKITPLERLKRSGPIEQAQLIARLKSPAATES